ncbi:MAG: M48 family metalloprotease [Bacteroidota bacterium]
MSRYLQFVLVLVYALYSYWLFVYCTALDKDFHYLFPWLLFCFSGSWWFPPYQSLFSRLRNPILEEEQLIRGCLDEVLSRAGQFRHIRLVLESRDMHAMFATGTNTIGFSQKTVKLLEAQELKAVIAHELGHLTTHDTLALGAYQACSFLPNKIMHGYKWLRFIVARGTAWVVLPLVTILSAAIMFTIVRGHGLLLLRVILFIFTIVKLQFLFRLVQNMIARYTEYRQDAFAQKLGYGLALKSALIKLSAEEKCTPSPFENFLFGNHPLTYNRIRRLEKLEGLRPDG